MSAVAVDEGVGGRSGIGRDLGRGDAQRQPVHFDLGSGAGDDGGDAGGLGFVRSPGELLW